jgi:hypothetical protein
MQIWKTDPLWIKNVFIVYKQLQMQLNLRATGWQTPHLNCLENVFMFFFALNESQGLCDDDFKYLVYFKTKKVKIQIYVLYARWRTPDF